MSLIEFEIVEAQRPQHAHCFAGHHALTFEEIGRKAGVDHEGTGISAVFRWGSVPQATRYLLQAGNQPGGRVRKGVSA